MQPSWGEPLWELQDVRSLVNSSLAVLSYVMPHSQPCQRQQCYVPCWCRDSHFRRTSIPARRGAAASRATPTLGSHFRSVIFPRRAPFSSYICHSPFCGFSVIKVRFLITWEAVEHDGPYVIYLHLTILAPADCRHIHKHRGIYDTSYLSYLRSVLSLFPQFGLTAFVALHQDVWSRYAGGSGAPAWTLELAGFDLNALEESDAAWLRGVRGGGHSEAERGLWPCGYQKLAAATMA